MLKATQFEIKNTPNGKKNGFMNESTSITADTNGNSGNNNEINKSTNENLFKKNSENWRKYNRCTHVIGQYYKQYRQQVKRQLFYSIMVGNIKKSQKRFRAHFASCTLVTICVWVCFSMLCFDESFVLP